MELTKNANGEFALQLTNADNEVVFVKELTELIELIDMVGDVEKVEIYYPKAGWCYLANGIRVKNNLTEESRIEEEHIEGFFEVWETEVEVVEDLGDDIYV